MSHHLRIVNKPAKCHYQAFGEKFYKTIIILSMLTSLASAYLTSWTDSSLIKRFQILQWNITHPEGWMWKEYHGKKPPAVNYGDAQHGKVQI